MARARFPVRGRARRRTTWRSFGGVWQTVNAGSETQQILLDADSFATSSLQEVTLERIRGHILFDTEIDLTTATQNCQVFCGIWCEDQTRSGFSSALIGRESLLWMDSWGLSADQLTSAAAGVEEQARIAVAFQHGKLSIDCKARRKMADKQLYLTILNSGTPTGARDLRWTAWIRVLVSLP